MTIVGIIAGVYVGLKYIFPVMIPFFVGWLLAVWMYPSVCRLERKTGVKRSFWAAIFMCGIAGLLAFLLYLGSVELLAQLKAWIGNYQLLEEYGRSLMNGCCDTLEQVIGISSMDAREFLVGSVEKLRGNFLDDFGSNLFLQVTDCIKVLALAVSGAVITVIAGVLFVKDLADIRKNLRTYRFYPRWRRVLLRMKQTGITYLKAQGIIMTVIAAISTLGMWLMKSPYYLLFGIGLGALDALPVIGTGLILYPAALFCFARGNTWLAVGCLLLECVTSVTREFMEPRLIGNSIGIYPVVIMAAVYVGFFVFGIFGFILGPVGLLLIYAIGKEWDIWD